MPVPVLLKSLSRLFFPVRKVPISEILENKEMDTTAKLSHAIIADTPQGPKFINSCSKNYHLITNEDLMTPLVKRLEKEFNVEARVKQHDYTKFYTDFIIKDKAMEVIKKDTIFPRIRMNNSYDGSVKYSFSFGFHRLVCSNGLTAPVQGMESADFKLRHTSGTGPTAVDKTMAAIELFLDKAPEILSGFDDMAKSKLKWDEAMQLIEAVTDETKFPKKGMEAAAERLKKEMEMGYALNRFLLYNAINHTIYNNPSQMKTHKRDKLDAEVLKLLSNS